MLNNNREISYQDSEILLENRNEDNDTNIIPFESVFEIDDDSPAAVVGEDNRTSVSLSQLSVLPYRSTCRLFITGTNGKSFIGTGIFISHNCVLTAAHNLYYYTMGGNATSITVTPAFNSTGGEYGTTKAIRLRMLDEYRQYEDIDTRTDESSNRSKSFDIGLINTEHALGNQTGFLDVLALSKQELEDSNIQICGYPYTKNSTIYTGTQQFEHTGKIRNDTIEPHTFQCNTDSSSGQSGSGCIITRNGNTYIVGVHIGSGNYAVRINDEVYNKIQEWKQLYA